MLLDKRPHSNKINCFIHDSLSHCGLKQTTSFALYIIYTVDFVTLVLKASEKQQ